MCQPKRHSNIIKQAQEEGYNGVKIRIKAKTLDEDAKTIRETRSRVDQSFPLMIDANQGWLVTIVDRTPSWGRSEYLVVGRAIRDACL